MFLVAISLMLTSNINEWLLSEIKHQSSPGKLITSCYAIEESHTASGNHQMNTENLCTILFYIALLKYLSMIYHKNEDKCFWYLHNYITLLNEYGLIYLKNKTIHDHFVYLMTEYFKQGLSFTVTELIQHISKQIIIWHFWIIWFDIYHEHLVYLMIKHFKQGLPFTSFRF